MAWWKCASQKSCVLVTASDLLLWVVLQACLVVGFEPGPGLGDGGQMGCTRSSPCLAGATIVTLLDSQQNAEALMKLSDWPAFSASS
jgi:hypothetical protein